MHHSSQAGNRAAELTGLLNAAPSDPTDHEAVGKYIRQLAEAGLAVLFIYPGSKLPADLRIPQQRNADDRKAREAARDAGRRDWQRVKSAAGLALATTDTDMLDRYLKRYVELFSTWQNTDGEVVPFNAKKAAELTMAEPVAVNLAVETGGSRLVVIDCDTAAQLERFYDVALPEGVPAENRPVPTILTPGQVGKGGDAADGDTWAHRDGGHFWFTVPEGIELSTSVGTMTWPGDDGFAVLWDHRYALIPPSVRPEGAYSAPGEVHDLAESGWLVEAITDYAGRRIERSGQRAGEPADGDMAARIDAWAEGVSWASILEPLSWTLAARADSCGCEVWTAPGPHGSPKSATAHDSGCTAGRYTETNAPLHIWTDHDRAPFDAWLAERGTATLSKLQAVAAGYYDNDTGAAMDDLGIEASDIDAMVPPGEALPADFGKAAPDSDATDQARTRRRLRVTWASEIEPAPVKWLWVDRSSHNAVAVDPHRLTDIACVAQGHTWTPPEVETEGRIACGMVSVAAGREGSGKSSFGIWLAAKMTRGELPGAHYGTPRRVYYLATEDSWQHTLVPRLMASGADLSMIARVEVVVNRSDTLTLCLPDDVGLLADSIAEHDVALVVVDPLMSTINDSLSTNNTREVRTALEPLAAMADQTGASVVCIAHFNKATGLDAASRISGSGAFKDLARAVMVFAVGPDGERVFSQPKNSVGRNDLPSLSYTVEGAVVDTPTGKAATAVLRFTGQAEHSVEDMLADERGRNQRKSDVMTFLVDYITEHAEEHSGEVPAADVIAAGTDKGFTENQIKLARRRCDDPKIATRREGFGEDGKTFWRLDVAG